MTQQTNRDLNPSIHVFSIVEEEVLRKIFKDLGSGNMGRSRRRKAEKDANMFALIRLGVVFGVINTEYGRLGLL